MEELFDPAARRVSVVIPTYQRDEVLLDTISSLINLETPPAEIVVVDQTVRHKQDVHNVLSDLDRTGKIRWIRLPQPSIPNAMNVGLKEARHEVVLFLDDDVLPSRNLLKAHAQAHAERKGSIVAGQILEQGEMPSSAKHPKGFRFSSSVPQFIPEFMGGNFSVRRTCALRLGGFDTNFIYAAYRFEAEFAERALRAGEKIFFEPQASIRHFKAVCGGIRAFGHHLTTIRPCHSVGEYYYLLRSRNTSYRFLKVLGRAMRSIRTKHHVVHPWWIPATMIAECSGFVLALMLVLRGPRLLSEAMSNA